MQYILEQLKTIPHREHHVNRYVSFVEKIHSLGQRNLEYSERHHILPKSLFPSVKNLSKNPWNIIRVSYREHFICHLMLFKCFSDEIAKSKMLDGLSKMMCSSKDHQGFRVLSNSKYYETKRKLWYERHSKRDYSYLRGKNHFFFGGRTDGLDQTGSKNPTARKCTIGDLEFGSIIEASQFFNLPYKWTYNRVVNNRIPEILDRIKKDRQSASPLLLEEVNL